jgi:hypothetical protein
MRNTKDKIILKALEPTEMSRFYQLIYSGLLRLIDFMINGTLFIKSFSAGGFGWQQINFANEFDNLSIRLYFRQKFTNFSLSFNVLK